ERQMHAPGLAQSPQVAPCPFLTREGERVRRCAGVHVRRSHSGRETTVLEWCGPAQPGTAAPAGGTSQHPHTHACSRTHRGPFCPALGPTCPLGGHRAALATGWGSATGGALLAQAPCALRWVR